MKNTSSEDTTSYFYQLTKSRLLKDDIIVGYCYYVRIPETLDGSNRIERIHDSRLDDNPLDEVTHDKIANTQYDQYIAASTRQMKAKNLQVYTSDVSRQYPPNTPSSSVDNSDSMISEGDDYGKPTVPTGKRTSPTSFVTQIVQHNSPKKVPSSNPDFNK